MMNGKSGIARSLLAGFVVSLGLGAASAVGQSAKVDPARVEASVKDLFSVAPPQWQARAAMDETQAACSAHRDAPPKDVEAAILAREKANVVLPADGNFMGDWKKGEALAQNGYGGRHTDDPARTMGGNCYACHQLSKTEVSYGTMGPPLVEYGKVRKYSADDIKAAYAKIYNAQAVFACSKMPRFGASKHLTEQQIKDIVALLFDPESPVNK